MGMGWEIDLLGSKDVGAEGVTVGGDQAIWGCAIANTMLAVRLSTSGDLKYLIVLIRLHGLRLDSWVMIASRRIWK